MASKPLNLRLLKLSEDTGFPIVQSNGQRLFGPHPSWKHFHPSKGCEIFVGKIPRDVFEDVLVPVFTQAGPIYQMRLMMDYSGMNRGYGFLRYTKQEHAKRAVAMLDGYEIKRNCFLGVYASVDNCRLFIGGIPTNRSKEEVLTVLQELVDGIEDVIMYPTPDNPDRNRGYVFVEFVTHGMAAIARRQLYYGAVLWETQIMVDWADPIPQVDPHTMSRVTKLYVRSLDVDMTNSQLWSYITSWINPAVIRRIHKINDYAFIHFTDRREAEIGLVNLTGKYLDGKVLDVQWARPRSFSKKNRITTPPNNLCTSLPPKMRKMVNMSRNKNSPVWNSDSASSSSTNSRESPKHPQICDNLVCAICKPLSDDFDTILNMTRYISDID